MLIRITGDICEEVSKLTLPVMASLSEKLNKYFIDRFYGGEIKQFTAVIVAVYDDMATNAKLAEKYNKVGRYKEPFTKEDVKYFSIGLSFDYRKVALLTTHQLSTLISSEIIHHLDNTFEQKGKLKEFDYNKFVTDIREAL